MEPDKDLRQAALAQAMRQRPDLVGSDAPEAREELSTLAARIEADLRLQAEVEEVRRREVAEMARRQGEAARHERQVRDAKLADERRRNAERERQEHLSRMSKPRRFIATHPILSGTLVLAVGLIVVVTASTINGVVSAARERVEAEARAAADAQVAAQAEAEAEAAQMAEQERLANLATQCDLTVPESEIPPEVWIAWLQCPDVTVVRKAAIKADFADLSDTEMVELANTTQAEEVAKRLSLLIVTPPAAHEALVDRWPSEVVAESYKKVYEQQCTTGVRPENYLGGTTWKTNTGDVVEFIAAGCRVRGFPDTTWKSSVFGPRKETNTRWSQLPDEVRITEGGNYYVGDGIGEYRIRFGADDAPRTLTRLD